MTDSEMNLEPYLLYLLHQHEYYCTNVLTKSNKR